VVVPEGARATVDPGPAGQETERRMPDGYEIMTFHEMAMRAMPPAGDCPARNGACR
jgi:hypothetical protein